MRRRQAPLKDDPVIRDEPGDQKVEFSIGHLTVNLGFQPLFRKADFEGILLVKIDERPQIARSFSLISTLKAKYSLSRSDGDHLAIADEVADSGFQPSLGGARFWKGDRPC